MAMPLATYFSADAVRALPDDGNRYETVHGELLVTPAPGGFHQLILTRLAFVLGQYLAAHGLEALLTSPADISWSPDTLVQPDLFVGDLGALLHSGKWVDVKTLYLAVEIMSPSSVRADRFTKRRLYQEQRVPAYWVVDIEHRQVEVWTPDALFPTIETVQLSWRYPDLEADCAIDVVKLFHFGVGA
jgi:Uma2 family endonuclease